MPTEPTQHAEKIAANLERLLYAITERPRAFRWRDGQIEWIELRDWPIRGWQVLSLDAEQSAGPPGSAGGDSPTEPGDER